MNSKTKICPSCQEATIPEYEQFCEQCTYIRRQAQEKLERDIREAEKKIVMDYMNIQIAEQQKALDQIKKYNRKTLIVLLVEIIFTVMLAILFYLAFLNG